MLYLFINCFVSFFLLTSFEWISERCCIWCEKNCFLICFNNLFDLLMLTMLDRGSINFLIEMCHIFRRSKSWRVTDILNTFWMTVRVFSRDTNKVPDIFTIFTWLDDLLWMGNWSNKLVSCIWELFLSNMLYFSSRLMYYI